VSAPRKIKSVIDYNSIIENSFVDHINRCFI